MTNMKASAAVVGLGHVEAFLVLHKQIAHTLDTGASVPFSPPIGDLMAMEVRSDATANTMLLLNILAVAIVALSLVLAACNTSAEDEASRR